MNIKKTLTKPCGLVFGHDEPRVIVEVHVVGEGDSPVGDGGASSEARQQHKDRGQELSVGVNDTQIDSIQYLNFTKK